MKISQYTFQYITAKSTHFMRYFLFLLLGAENAIRNQWTIIYIFLQITIFREP